MQNIEIDLNPKGLIARMLNSGITVELVEFEKLAKQHMREVAPVTIGKEKSNQCVQILFALFNGTHLNAKLNFPSHRFQLDSFKHDSDVTVKTEKLKSGVDERKSENKEFPIDVDEDEYANDFEIDTSRSSLTVLTGKTGMHPCRTNTLSPIKIHAPSRSFSNVASVITTADYLLQPSEYHNEVELNHVAVSEAELRLQIDISNQEDSREIHGGLNRQSTATTTGSIINLIIKLICNLFFVF